MALATKHTAIPDLSCILLSLSKHGITIDRLSILSRNRPHVQIGQKIKAYVPGPRGEKISNL